MKIKTTAHVHYQKYAWQEKGEYRLASFKLDDTAERTYVGEQEIDVDIPDDYDPRAHSTNAGSTPRNLRLPQSKTAGN